MPKRSKEEYDSDDGFVADAPHSAKKSRSNNPSSAVPVGAPGEQKTGDDGDAYWELNAAGTRRATVGAFKGATMVSVREFYAKDGRMLPGKKGISLSVEQFNALVTALPGIERALVEKGESVARPVYGAQQSAAAAAAASVKDAKDEEMDEGGEGETKQNFEATSDEDDE